MGILTTQDKEKIKRVIPKANNKIIDATVARLYTAYPDPTKWTYTGLVGAIVLVDDLVGHTFFLKLVDILGHRGVVWDQELYVNFEYNQDRKFFHTFEIEECLIGLLFEDTNDATHFYKRVTARQKHGSKQTVNNKNAIALKDKTGPQGPQKPGPRGEFVDVNTAQRSRRTKGVLYYDDVPPPEWRSLYSELAAAGISEDMIADNREFIKDYIAQQGGPLVGLEPPIPRKFQRKHESIQESKPQREDSNISTKSSKFKKAPPPPPPPSAPSTVASSNSSTPAPPAYVAMPTDNQTDSSDLEANHATPAETPSPTPSPPPAAEPAKSRFRVPPMNAVAPKVFTSSLSPPSSQQQVQSPALPPQNARPLPQVPNASVQQSAYGVPPRNIHSQAHSVPPAFPQTARLVPPPPPARANAPPPPPRAAPMAPQRTNATAAPPPPPPRAARSAAPPPPPPRATRTNAPPTLPPLQQQSYHNQLPQQQQYQLSPQSQLPPYLPQFSLHNSSSVSAPPSQTTVQSSVPPAPPLPSGSAAPPPPPPPPPPMPDLSNGGTSTPSAPLPTLDPSRDVLLASIRGAGGIGSLRKTDKSQLEKTSVLLQEARGEVHDPANTANGGQNGAQGGQPGSLADALALALNKRKGKVARSDDEDDEDDW